MPPVTHITVPEVLQVSKPYTATDCGSTSTCTTKTCFDYHLRHCGYGWSFSVTTNWGGQIIYVGGASFTTTIYPSTEVLLQCRSIFRHTTTKSTMVAHYPNTPFSMGMATIMTMPSKTDVPRIYTWSLKKVFAFDSWCRNHQIFTLPVQERWHIVNFLFLRP